MKRIILVIALLLPLTAQAQTAEQNSAITEFNNLASALQVTSGAFEHTKTSLKTMVEQAVKDRAELEYWRKYVGTSPKEP